MKENLTDPHAKKKISRVMREYYAGKLHSGGSGEIVTNPAQAKAIAMSEGRRVLKLKLRK